MIWKRGFVIFVIFLFLVVAFVLAAPSAPTDLIFNNNATADYDQGNFFLNWTSGGGDAEANYTIYLFSNNTLYATAQNGSATGYVFSNTTESNYTFIVEAWNGTGFKANSSGNISIYVDSSAPSIALPVYTNATAKKNSTTLTLNISVLDGLSGTTGTSCLIDVNGSNQSIGFLGGWCNGTIGLSGLNDGNHTLNVYVNDTVNNVGLNDSFIVQADTTAPTASLSESSSTTTSITVSFSCSDNLDSGPSCVLSSSSGTVSGSTISGLSCGNSYTITVNATDSAGNTALNSDSMSTSSCGGTGSTSDPPFYTNTFVEDDVDFTQKRVITRELAEKHRVRIKFDGETHYIGVKSITGSSAVIEVASEPQEVTLNVAETKKFDLNGDNSYDLEVILNSILDSKASITLLSIEEPVPEGEITSGETPGEAEGAEETKTNLTWLWILIGVILVVAVVWFFLKKTKRS
ncbi:MAG: hypothetical protein KKB62_03245 [Nanoarchaeota archaeon]|nr:hypothetical protein [Nanoarchaeota archaeon]